MDNKSAGQIFTQTNTTKASLGQIFTQTKRLKASLGQIFAKTKRRPEKASVGPEWAQLHLDKSSPSQNQLKSSVGRIFSWTRGDVEKSPARPSLKYSFTLTTWLTASHGLVSESNPRQTTTLNVLPSQLRCSAEQALPEFSPPSAQSPTPSAP